MALKFLSAVVSQGSADAYAEAEFSTGLSNVARTAFRVRRVEFYVPNLIGADSFVQVRLARTSQASMSLQQSNIMLCGIQRYMELTTSGMIVGENFSPANVYRYDRDEDLLIVEESLFLSIDSNGTSASNGAYCRIGYETRTVTENERLSILALSAQG